MDKGGKAAGALSEVDLGANPAPTPASDFISLSLGFLEMETMTPSQSCEEDGTPCQEKRLAPCAGQAGAPEMSNGYNYNGIHDCVATFQPC